jgi:hypothetical protein
MQGMEFVRVVFDLYSHVMCYEHHGSAGCRPFNGYSLHSLPTLSLAVFLADTGVDHNDTELQGRVFHLETGTGLESGLGHGATVLARIIAGKETGLAPWATIISVQVAVHSKAIHPILLSGLEKILFFLEENNITQSIVVLPPSRVLFQSNLSQRAKLILKLLREAGSLLIQGGKEEPESWSFGDRLKTLKNELTVGSIWTTEENQIQYGAGNAVDLYAPGEPLYSYTNITKYIDDVYGATAMAAAYVAGIAAAYMSSGLNASETVVKLLDRATPGQLQYDNTTQDELNNRIVYLEPTLTYVTG